MQGSMLLQEGLLLWQLGPAELTAQPVRIMSNITSSIAALHCSSCGEATALTTAGDVWSLSGLPALLPTQDPATSSVSVLYC